MVLQLIRGDNILDFILINYSDMFLDVEVGELIFDYIIVIFKINVNFY